MITPPVRPLNVVCISGSNTIRQVTKVFLSVDGHNVMGIAPTEDALSTLDVANINVLLIDAKADSYSFDGVAFCHRMRNTIGKEGTPILVLMGDAKDLEEIDRHPHDLHLKKPFKTDTLKSLMVNCSVELHKREKCVLRTIAQANMLRDPEPHPPVRPRL